MSELDWGPGVDGRPGRGARGRVSRHDDDADPACVDCAVGRCARCRDLDPARLGERECCCGRVADVTIWRDGERVQ